MTFLLKSIIARSLGQVHKAVLKTTGETVAVKVLCPGMESKFRADIRTLKSFCRLAMPQHVTAFAEIEKQFCTGNDSIIVVTSFE
jgi:predicted unusual protein kinase regulating ubiquinone biosynthesis (AarF/ABC1/UbiB family)